MCRAASGPISEKTGPVRQERPWLDDDHHHPMFSMLVIVAGVLYQARTQRGITMAKKPQRCKLNINPSIRASFLAKKVLKTAATMAAAITSRIPYHLSYT